MAKKLAPTMRIEGIVGGQTDYDVQRAKRDLGRLLDRIATVNKPKAA